MTAPDTGIVEAEQSDQLPPKTYSIYEIECVTPGHFYVGYSNDVEKRIRQHKEKKGSIFTRWHGVKSWRVAAVVTGRDADGRRLEKKTIKDLRRAHPEYVVNSEWHREPCGCISIKCCPTHRVSKRP